MNVFGVNQPKDGQPKAQFATFFAKKCTCKDNRLLCMLRYGFVIKPGRMVCFWDYILIVLVIVSFYIVILSDAGEAAGAAAACAFLRPSSSYILRNIGGF